MNHPFIHLSTRSSIHASTPPSTHVSFSIPSIHAHIVHLFNHPHSPTHLLLICPPIQASTHPSIHVLVMYPSCMHASMHPTTYACTIHQSTHPLMRLRIRPYTRSIHLLTFPSLYLHIAQGLVLRTIVTHHPSMHLITSYHQSSRLTNFQENHSQVTLYSWSPCILPCPPL